MGCCLSKNHDIDITPSPPYPPKAHLSLAESDPHCVKAPLSPVFEEESVKEVLSETSKPKPKPKPEPKPLSLLKTEGEDKQEETKVPIPAIPPVSNIEEEKKVEVFNNVTPEEISEVSEICSLSESISTTTLTERKEDEDGEVQQRVHRSPAKALRKRSIPGDFVGRHERGSKSPARRLNPSPGRRNDSSSEVGQTARRRVSENNRVRRDLADRSARRSRSPATRANLGTTRSGVGRSPSKRAPRSPARNPTKEPDSCRKVEEETKEGNSTNESIENPLVSLECFIFL